MEVLNAFVFVFAIVGATGSVVVTMFTIEKILTYFRTLKLKIKYIQEDLEDLHKTTDKIHKIHKVTKKYR